MLIKNKTITTWLFPLNTQVEWWSQFAFYFWCLGCYHGCRRIHWWAPARILSDHCGYPVVLFVLFFFLNASLACSRGDQAFWPVARHLHSGLLSPSLEGLISSPVQNVQPSRHRCYTFPRCKFKQHIFFPYNGSVTTSHDSTEMQQPQNEILHRYTSVPFTQQTKDKEATEATNWLGEQDFWHAKNPFQFFFKKETFLGFFFRLNLVVCLFVFIMLWQLT